MSVDPIEWRNAKSKKIVIRELCAFPALQMLSLWTFFRRLHCRRIRGRARAKFGISERKRGGGMAFSEMTSFKRGPSNFAGRKGHHIFSWLCIFKRRFRKLQNGNDGENSVIWQPFEPWCLLCSRKALKFPGSLNVRKSPNVSLSWKGLRTSVGNRLMIMKWWK